MAARSLTRFAGVFAAGFVLLAMVMGSVWLAQLDPDLRVQRAPLVNVLSTPTLFPTLVPATPTRDTTPLPGSTPTEEPPATLTPTLTAAEVCSIPEDWLPYTVRRDETVDSLAQRAQTSAYLLLQANCWTAQQLPAVGDTLYLPPIAFMAPTPIIARCGPPATWRKVLVQRGDTLYGLSVRYRTTVQAIRDANCLVGDLLYAGQPLFLPPVVVWWPTPTLEPLPTWTPTLTLTPTEPTLEPTPVFTPTPTLPVDTPVPTLPVDTETPTPTPPADTETPTPTPTPTETPTPTATPTPASEPTPTPTPLIPSLTPTPTITLIPSLTPTPTPTP